MVEEGFFLGLDPWPNVDIDMGLRVFYPPQGSIATHIIVETPHDQLISIATHAII